jgi:hypothetical protein
MRVVGPRCFGYSYACSRICCYLYAICICEKGIRIHEFCPFLNIYKSQSFLLSFLLLYKQEKRQKTIHPTLNYHHLPLIVNEQTSYVEIPPPKLHHHFVLLPELCCTGSTRVGCRRAGDSWPASDSYFCAACCCYYWEFSVEMGVGG